MCSWVLVCVSVCVCVCLPVVSMCVVQGKVLPCTVDLCGIVISALPAISFTTKDLCVFVLLHVHFFLV